VILSEPGFAQENEEGETAFDLGQHEEKVRQARVELAAIDEVPRVFNEPLRTISGFLCFVQIKLVGGANMSQGELVRPGARRLPP
jgi:hypothetical protein